LLLALTVSYFLIAFAFYAFADMQAWKFNYGSAQEADGDTLSAAIEGLEAKLLQSYDQAKNHNGELLEIAAKFPKVINFTIIDGWVSTRESDWATLDTTGLGSDDYERIVNAVGRYGVAIAANKELSTRLYNSRENRSVLREALLRSPVARIRTAFDFALPVLVGTYALVAALVSL
jgi:hypothetical protein